MVIIPEVSTLRILLLPISAIYKFPEESKVISNVPYNLASIAKPPSPEYSKIPATLVIIPEVSTLRIV